MEWNENANDKPKQNNRAIKSQSSFITTTELFNLIRISVLCLFKQFKYKYFGQLDIFG